MKVTDPKGDWKLHKVDAFGNLVQVQKPTADTMHAGNYVTDYTYMRWTGCEWRR